MADVFLIPYVRSVWRVLGHRLAGGRRMILFGAGAHTRWLLSITRDLPILPIECIVDDDPKLHTLAGIDVRRPADVDVDGIDLVLVSSDRWEDALVERIRVLWRDRVEIERLYEGLPQGPYDKTDDRSESLRLLARAGKTASVTDRQVVIVSDQPRSREAKLGLALKHAGWHPVLLHRRAPNFDAARYFDEVHTYENCWQALRIALTYSPEAYHVMVNTDYRVAELFVERRPGIVVVDSYDLIAGMYADEFLARRPDLTDQIERERYCLEHADGLCCRSREVAFVGSALGYNTAPRLLFPDGCWNMPQENTHGTERTATQVPRKDSRHSSLATEASRSVATELHTVYAGHMPLDVANAGGLFGHGSKLWQARTLADQGIHFHLYPWCDRPWSELRAELGEYHELERSSKYFHLHQPVAADDLIGELSRYDLAMFLYNEFVCPEQTAATYSKAKLRSAASNKLFDFIDAGLPVVHTAAEGSYQSSLLDKHDIRIELGGVPPGEWGDVLRSVDIESVRQRVADARKDYDVRRHVAELIDFYGTLRTRRCHGGGTTRKQNTASERDAVLQVDPTELTKV